MPTVEQARNWYTNADPIHDFEHVLRVYRMAERLAQAEDADLEIVQAAAWLHDAQGSAPGKAGSRAGHHEASADFAHQVLLEEGWVEAKIQAVAHCIRAHRYRSTETPSTIEAKVLFDADKLDVLGAIGAARTIGYAVLAGQPIFSQPSDKFLASFEKEPGEGHSSYHEYLFKLVNVKDRLFTESAKKIAADRHQYLRGFYEQIAAEVKGDR